jgi:hypothetical protein
MLSLLSQALLPLAGAVYAVWRFWVGREYRSRFRTTLDCSSTDVGDTTVLDAVYTVQNISRRMFEIRSATVSAMLAVVDPETGRLGEGELLVTKGGHATKRLIHPREEKLKSISPLLPDEYAGFSLRVLLDDLPPYIFVVGEIEIEGIHEPGDPGRYVKLHCGSPSSPVQVRHVAHARRTLRSEPARQPVRSFRTS